MKKIVTTLALAGAFGFAANAQRSADVGIVAYPPLSIADTTALTLIECSPGDTDSFLMAYGIKNNGPDNLVVGDSIFIQDPEVASASNVWSFTLDAPLNVGDSTILYLATTTYGMTNLLYTITAENTLVPHEAPIANGNYWYLFILDRVSGLDGAITDGNQDNNIGGTEIEFRDCPTGILSNSKNSQITVFPNPTANQLNFVFDFEKAANATVKVYDIAGRLVVSQDFGKQAAGVQNFTLDVTGLANGNYTLELATDNNKGVSKFVIAK